VKLVVDGLPGWSGTAAPDRLAGDEERDAALAVLAKAVADGRVQPAKTLALEADIRHARRVRDLGDLLSGLAARVGDRERRDALDALAEAHRDGRLDAAEHAARAAQVPALAADADLGDLVDDLRGEARRLTEAERDEVAGKLRAALDEGRLDLSEFDERVRAAHAATTAADLMPLVADLAVPARPPRRGWTDALFDRFVGNSAMLPAAEHRWLRWVWKGSTGATVVAYGVVAASWNTTFTLELGWLALAAALWAETAAARLIAVPDHLRREALLPVAAGLDRLATANDAIEDITVEYPAMKGEGPRSQRSGASRRSASAGRTPTGNSAPRCGRRSYGCSGSAGSTRSPRSGSGPASSPWWS